MAGAGIARADTGSRQAAHAIDGKCFLIVEDEPLVALDISSRLEAAGARIIGPVENTAAALAAIAGEDFDAAMLDANLGGDPVDDIAAALRDKRVPFAFVSGYDRESLPGSFDDAELLPKPFTGNDLLAVAARLVGG